jgi:hypothetical protein
VLREIAATALFMAPFAVFVVLWAMPASLFYLAIALINVGVREKCLQAMSRFLACAVLCSLFFVAFKSAHAWRHVAFVRASEVGNEVVAALDKFHARAGVYPASLDELTPNLISNIPRTGMVGYPDFYYHKSDGNRTLIDGNAEYELGIECPSGGLNWDRFFFWPDQDYPPFIYGGDIERIGNWAYVHE